MRYVYIVQEGDYSDKRLCSVWTTLEGATRAAGEHQYIERWELNTPEPAAFRAYHAYLDKEENIVVQEAGIDSPNLFWSRATVTRFGKSDSLHGNATGITEEHARKNLSDALAKFRAEEAGL